MVLSKMLVILFPPFDLRSAENTIQRAIQTAARPLGLRFALPGALQGMEAADAAVSSIRALTVVETLSVVAGIIVVQLLPGIRNPKWKK